MSIREDQRVQYWLVELDQHDNPTLVDGAHSSERGAHKAMYLYQRFGFDKGGNRFAVAKVELFDINPTAEGVDQDAVRMFNDLGLK